MLIYFQSAWLILQYCLDAHQRLYISLSGCKFANDQANHILFCFHGEAAKRQKQKQKLSEHQEPRNPSTSEDRKLKKMEKKKNSKEIEESAIVIKSYQGNHGGRGIRRVPRETKGIEMTGQSFSFTKVLCETKMIDMKGHSFS